MRDLGLRIQCLGLRDLHFKLVLQRMVMHHSLENNLKIPVPKLQAVNELERSTNNEMETVIIESFRRSMGVCVYMYIYIYIYIYRESRALAKVLVRFYALLYTFGDCIYLVSNLQGHTQKDLPCSRTMQKGIGFYWDREGLGFRLPQF